MRMSVDIHITEYGTWLIWLEDKDDNSITEQAATGAYLLVQPWEIMYHKEKEIIDAIPVFV